MGYEERAASEMLTNQLDVPRTPSKDSATGPLGVVSGWLGEVGQRVGQTLFGAPATIDGKAMTRGFEGGFHPEEYDVNGVPHQGYGFNLNTYPMYRRDYMEREEGDKIFDAIYNTAGYTASAYVGAPVFEKLSSMQQAILTDMAYNMGGKSLGSFINMREAIQQGKSDDVRSEMQRSDWFSQVGRRAEHHLRSW